MSKNEAETSRYVVDSDAEIGRSVPADEPVYDSHGARIDEDYTRRAVEDVHRALGRGH